MGGCIILHLSSHLVIILLICLVGLIGRGRNRGRSLRGRPLEQRLLSSHFARCLWRNIFLTRAIQRVICSFKTGVFFLLIWHLTTLFFIRIEPMCLLLLLSHQYSLCKARWRWVHFLLFGLGGNFIRIFP